MEPVESMKKKQQLDISHALGMAQRAYYEKNLSLAKQISKKILKALPLQCDALQLLGIIAHEEKKFDLATRYLKKAIRAEPSCPDFYNSLALTYMEQKRHQEAIQTFEKALKYKGDYVEAQLNIGNLQVVQGLLADAIESYEKAVRIRPHHLESYLALGSLLKKVGQSKRAIEIYQKALSFAKKNISLLEGLGHAFLEENLYQEAMSTFSEILRIDPRHTGTLNNLGNLLLERGDTQKALSYYRQAVKNEPDCAGSHSNLANALSLIGETEEASTHFEKAFALNPHLSSTKVNYSAHQQSLGKHDQVFYSLEESSSLEENADIPWINKGTHHLQAGELTEAERCFRHALPLSRENLDEVYDKLGSVYLSYRDYKKAIEYYEKAIQENPHNEQHLSNLLFSLHYSSENHPLTIFERHKEWGRIHAEEAQKRYTHLPQKKERLRIGYLSPDFCDHSVAAFSLPLLEKHDRTQFEVYCYARVLSPDGMTEKMKALSDQWRSVVGLSPESIAQLIHSDQIDILVDLAGHSRENCLKALTYKPAPIQMTYLGYPSTTGVPEVDYRLTSPLAEVEGAQRYYTESLLYLPETFLCYNPPEMAPPVASSPVLHKGRITFGSFNNIRKVGPEVVDVWAQILAHVPDAEIVIKYGSLKDPRLSEEILNQFLRWGVVGSRVHLIEGQPSKEEHLAQYAQIDIALDPFPYNGVTTSCEALWMGVPVLTLAQDTHCSRVGAQILHTLQLDEWITFHKEDYIERAVAYAQNRERLVELRSSLRDKMLPSPLCNASTFTKNVEQEYLKVWQQWLR